MSFSKLFKSSPAPTMPPELHREMEEAYEYVVAVASALFDAGVKDANLAKICTWGKRKFGNWKNPVKEEELKLMMEYTKTLFQEMSQVRSEQLGRCSISNAATGWAKYRCDHLPVGLRFKEWPDPTDMTPGDFGRYFVYAVAMLVKHVDEYYTAVAVADREYDNLYSKWVHRSILEEPQKRKPKRQQLNTHLVNWTRGISNFTK